VDDIISPALLESMCAEYDDIQDLIRELAAKMPQKLFGFGSFCPDSVTTRKASE
jgi:hypothetical protein